jgi:hypothetical protein
MGYVPINALDAAMSQTQSIQPPSLQSEIANYSTQNQSLLNQPPLPKADLKDANTPEKKQIVTKATVFPTVANGIAPTAPIPDPEDSVADFYRYGRFAEVGEGYDVNPRTFTPIESGPASIRIYGQGPKDKKPRDFLPRYTKFILENVTESHIERTQIIETFGDFYVFMFGERPPQYNFAGTLINAQNANWVSDFMLMYNLYLRGTRCVERNAKAILTYGGRMVEGLIPNITLTTNAQVEGGVGFQFSVIVFERKFLSFSEDMGYSTGDNEFLKQDENFMKLLGQIAGSVGTGTSQPGASAAQGAAKGVMGGAKAAAGLSKP